MWFLHLDFFFSDPAPGLRYCILHAFEDFSVTWRGNKAMSDILGMPSIALSLPFMILAWVEKDYKAMCHILERVKHLVYGQVLGKALLVFR
jgi:hypothetical protein